MSLQMKVSIKRRGYQLIWVGDLVEADSVAIWVNKVNQVFFLAKTEQKGILLKII